VIDFASALWNQRPEVRRAKDRLVQMHKIVNRPVDLNLGQWVQLYAFCLEFAPDLIIELGRGWGNSTCVFTEAANRLGTGRVVSVGNDAERTWILQTAPRLREVVPAQWFDALEVVQQDILNTDFSRVLAKGTRVFFYWDAHGHELGRYLLAEVLPMLAPRAHIVVVHDINDSRYCAPEPNYVSDNGPPQTWLGPLVGPFDELIPLYDFLSRNRIAFDTPNHSLHKRLLSDAARRSELQQAWGEDFPGPSPLEVGSWIYFDLHTREGRDRVVFPPSASGGSDVAVPGEMESLRQQVVELKARLTRLERVLGPVRNVRNGLRRLVGRAF